MGLGPAAVKLTLELWRRGLLKHVNSVLEMGAQELHLKLTDFEYLLNSAGIEDYPREQFKALSVWPGSPRLSSKHFYRLLGMNNYKCIDLQSTHDSIIVDLNYPLEDKNLLGSFDLVTDHGNNEHPYNMPEAYRTMHRLCAKDGLMIIMQGVLWGNGYFNFDESFFESLAAANKYQILFASYIIDLKEMTRAGSNIQLLVPLSRDLINAFEYSKIGGIYICYVFRKSSNDDFRYPYERGLRSEADKVLGYKLQFLVDPPSRLSIPIFEGDDVPIAAKKLVRMLIGRVLGKIKRMILRGAVIV